MKFFNHVNLYCKVFLFVLDSCPNICRGLLWLCKSREKNVKKFAHWTCYWSLYGLRPINFVHTDFSYICQTMVWKKRASRQQSNIKSMLFIIKCKCTVTFSFVLCMHSWSLRRFMAQEILKRKEKQKKWKVEDAGKGRHWSKRIFVENCLKLGNFQDLAKFTTPISMNDENKEEIDESFWLRKLHRHWWQTHELSNHIEKFSCFIKIHSEKKMRK